MILMKRLALAAAALLGVASMVLLVFAIAGLLADPAPGLDGMRHKSPEGAYEALGSVGAAWLAVAVAFAALSPKGRIILGILLLTVAGVGAVGAILPQDWIGPNAAIVIAVAWIVDIFAVVAWVAFSVLDPLIVWLRNLRRRRLGRTAPT